VCRDSGASRVLWNRRYEPASVARDRRIKAALRAAGIETGSFNGALLHEPWSVETKTGGPFQVFTPFWRHCKSLPEPADPLPAPARLPSPPQWPASVPLDDLGLLPSVDWAAGLRESWEPGSAAAARSVQRFLNEGFDTYDEGRNLPGVRGTSRLSPHLHFGEISPRQIWHATRRHAQGRGRHTTWRDSQFLAEVGWREFAHHLLYHFPHTPERPLRSNYERFPWVANDARLRAWCKGSTGYPIVDAGMRELWHTGWMHNRVRMINRVFPDQGSAHLVEHGCALVLGYAGRCGPREQYARLAVGRRLRGRCRSILPHFQSHHPGHEIRSARRVRAPLGAGTRATRYRLDSPAVGRAGVIARGRRRRTGEELPAADRRARNGATRRAEGAVRHQNAMIPRPAAASRQTMPTRSVSVFSGDRLYTLASSSPEESPTHACAGQQHQHCRYATSGRQR